MASYQGKIPGPLEINRAASSSFVDLKRIAPSRNNPFTPTKGSVCLSKYASNMGRPWQVIRLEDSLLLVQYIEENKVTMDSVVRRRNLRSKSKYPMLELSIYDSTMQPSPMKMKQTRILIVLWSAKPWSISDLCSFPRIRLGMPDLQRKVGFNMYTGGQKPLLIFQRKQPRPYSE